MRISLPLCSGHNCQGESDSLGILPYQDGGNSGGHFGGVNSATLDSACLPASHLLSVSHAMPTAALSLRASNVNDTIQMRCVHVPSQQGTRGKSPLNKYRAAIKDRRQGRLSRPQCAAQGGKQGGGQEKGGKDVKWSWSKIPMHKDIDQRMTQCHHLGGTSPPPRCSEKTA